MNIPHFMGITAIAFLWVSCNNHSLANLQDAANADHNTSNDTLKYDQEIHLKNLRQLTFGGDNAEAYWSFSGNKLIFQRSHPEEGIACDQIFIGDIPAGNNPFKMQLVSTGKGRTTCSYFLGGDSLILYSSTHHFHPECPPEPDRSQGYVWPIYKEFDIFIADLQGNIVRQLTNDTFYNAEATVSPTGDKIVYTSNKSGDLELYVLDLITGKEQQITHELGYDGGAFFSPDGKKIVWRSSRPQTDDEIKKYKQLLKQHLVAPSNMEIYVCNADGSDIKQVTRLGGANWAPYFHPDCKRILFSSNHKDNPRVFNIFMINEDGTGLKQITFDNTFDAFPMFSYDGKFLTFSSNRHNGGGRDTNIFLAEWVEETE
jgi:Tol biopolymer transport system component